MLSKICLFLGFSSLLHLIAFNLVLIIGIFIILGEFLKNYFFIFILKIHPNNKFKKNLSLLMLFTFWFYGKIIDFLLDIKEKLIINITSISQ